MVPLPALMSVLMSQEGDEYIFGVEVSPSDTNPAAFDCSELVEWACAQVQVAPRMPDGSWYQARHSANHAQLVSVEEGIATEGALLFRFSSSPFEGPRPSSAHVAVSRGDGTTIEARGARWGVGVFSTYNRGWTHAGLIPGIDYGGEEVAQFTPEEVKVLQDLTQALNDVGSNGWFAKFVVPKFREWNAADILERLERLEESPGSLTLPIDVRISEIE